MRKITTNGGYGGTKRLGGVLNGGGCVFTLQGKAKKGLLATAIAIGSIAWIAVSAVALRTFLYALIFLVVIGGMCSGRPSYEKTEKMFADDYEELSSIAGYFTSLKYKRVSIPNDIEPGMMSVDYTGDIKIEDTDILRAVATLMVRGYQHMDKTGNAVHFERWSMMEHGGGIAYSIDGTIITDGDRSGLDFLTRLEPLSEPDWYYYEVNYTEWRRRRD